MKFILFTVLLLVTLGVISCKKNVSDVHQVTFIEPFGTANVNGEYTIQGHISSSVRLDKIELIKQGQSNPFITDNTTAKNKMEHTFSYQVFGVNQDTWINLDVYDMEGRKTTSKFQIRK